MKKRIKIFSTMHIIQCCMILFFSMLQQELFAQMLSLDSVLSIIETNNPGLAAYENKIKSSDAMATGASAWMPPLLTAGLDEVPYDFSGDGSVLVGVEQMIPNPKKIRAKADYLNSISTLDRNNAGYYKNQLISKAKVAYNERCISERRIAIIDNNIKTLQFIKDLQQSNVAYGTSEIPGIYKIDAKISTMMAMKIHEQSNADENTTILNYLMNRPQSNTFKIDTAIYRKYKDLIYPDTSARAIEIHRSDIQFLNNSIHSIELNQTALSVLSKPDFGIRVEHYGMFNSMDRFSLMGMVTIPLVPWSSPEYKSQYNAGAFQISALEQEKQNALNEVQQKINMTYLHMQSESEEMQKYEQEILPAYKKDLDLNLISLQQNKGDLILVLMAIDDLQTAQMEYLYHVAEFLKSQTDYENELEIR